MSIDVQKNFTLVCAPVMFKSLFTVCGIRWKGDLWLEFRQKKCKKNSFSRTKLLAILLFL